MSFVSQKKEMQTGLEQHNDFWHCKYNSALYVFLILLKVCILSFQMCICE